MRICFVVNGYPHAYNPILNIFIQRLAWALSDKGEDITVIHPVVPNLNPSLLNLPYCEEEKTPAGRVVLVFSPKAYVLGL